MVTLGLAVDKTSGGDVHSDVASIDLLSRSGLFDLNLFVFDIIKPLFQDIIGSFVGLENHESETPGSACLLVVDYHNVCDVSKLNEEGSQLLLGQTMRQTTHKDLLRLRVVLVVAFRRL